MTQRLSIFVMAAFAVSGCVTDQPLLTTGVFSLDPDHKGACVSVTPSAAVPQLVAGSLDLAGGGNYVVEIGLENDLDPTLTTTGSKGEALLTGVHQNTVTVDTVTFTYTSVPAISFSQESVPLVFVIPPSTISSVLRTGIFTRQALEKLYASLPGTTNVGGLDVRDVKVKMVFSGSVVSGGRITSTPITFPLTIYNSGFTCPTAGDSFGLLGPCGTPGGQDGARLCCLSDATCTLPK